MTAKWYIVHTYSNFEKKVAEGIREQARNQNLEDRFEEIVVPTEEVIEVHRGRKRTAERRYFPGYVLVKMVLNDMTYHLVKNTPKVTGFLGSQQTPIPVSEKEVQRILGGVEEHAERIRPVIDFEIGERVKVKEGPFEGFEGQVEEIDEDRGRVKVSVSIFGRATPVDLEFAGVTKLN
jgi:transcriptional antiterminator NusG